MRQACAALVGATAVTGIALAEEPPPWQPGNDVTARVSPEVQGDTRRTGGDGVYGRFDGEVDLGAHGGAQIDDGVSALVGLTAHYYSMAGVYLRFADALGAEDAPRRRSLSFGVDLRPAFVPRWALDAHSGDAFFDLLVDSIALELGAYLADPRTEFGDERGFEVSLGLGVPLLASAPGPWVDARGLLRWGDPAASGRQAEAALLLSAGWHWMLETR